MKEKFYITTAIPYVNGAPHIGHALEYVVADTIHRMYELTGADTFFVSGADENALKNAQAADKAGIDIQSFLDKNSTIFRNFYKYLNVNLDEFMRGTDRKNHWPGVQRLWRMSALNNDIYKKKYKGLYCVGSESFVTKDELREGGLCPEHDEKPVVVEEENHFFRLSKYKDQLIKLIETGELEIVPEKRKNEALSFIKGGLTDISISRSAERQRDGVGIPVPGDESQKIYVWFDALTIYMTGVGWGRRKSLFQRYWPAQLHVIGKDILRFHAVYWPAMLLSASLPLPKTLLVHGFVTSHGRKMGKSLGNAVDPYDIIDKYGIEAVRYYLLSQIPTLDDGDFTIERFEQVYQSDLANGLGNLVSRTTAMARATGLRFKTLKEADQKISADVVRAVKEYNINRALELIWRRINKADRYINENRVWEKEGEAAREYMEHLVRELRQLAIDLAPFLPETSRKIKIVFADSTIDEKIEPLFPRLDKRPSKNSYFYTK